MHPNTIRNIDYWVGNPLCFLLTLLHVFFPKKTGKPERIIFLKFTEQGATVLAFRAIQRAIEIVGRENVFFCVFEGNRPILDIIDLIPGKNIITISEKNFFSFLVSVFSALVKIRKKKIDTSIDLEFFSRASAIFSFLSGARTRVGLHRFTAELPYRGNLMTHRIQYNPYMHISAFYYLLVEASLYDPSETPMMKIIQKDISFSLPTFIPANDERKKMIDKLSKKEGEKIVLLNPNASDLLPLRKWESKKFVALGKKLISENPHVRVVITGSLPEQKTSEEICKQIGTDKVMSLAGKTTLRELLVLYSISDILITNDSGPGHFSSLTNIRTVVLFGPETPKLFGPISPNTHIIWKELTCSPCVNVFNHRFSPCNNNVCMQSITVDEVYAAIMNFL